MSYVKLNRNIDDFYKRIELVLDILSLNSPPDFTEDCNDCNFVKKQIEFNKN